jgi:hypothetical protein
MTLMLFSGAWGKMIQEKNPEQKSSDTVPLKFRWSVSFPLCLLLISASYLAVVVQKASCLI